MSWVVRRRRASWWSGRSGRNWSSRLIAGLTPAQRDPTRNHTARLGALHIGGSMWADYSLRPNGEVVVVGEDYDHPDVDTVHTDRSNVLRVLVWGSQRYPELRELLPARPPGAVDCLVPADSDVRRGQGALFGVWGTRLVGARRRTRWCVVK